MKSVVAVFLILILSTSASLYGRGPEFDIRTISDDDRLLFTADTFSPGTGIFSTLLLADIADRDRITTLTHYPERVRYFPALAELEIQNRYGLYRMPVSVGGRIREISSLPSFDRGAEIPIGRFLPVSTSPDGRWTVVQEPVDGLRGYLVLHDNVTGDRTGISEGQLLDYRSVPVMWSPDSRYLLYERDGSIYYASLHHVASDRLPDEAYREYGKGTLNAMRWNSSDSLIHIDGSIVSRIRPSEFFTGAFYRDPLPVGSSTGEIPFDFNPHFDRFWPSPDGDSLIILSGERNLFLFPVGNGESGAGENLPYLLLPDESTVSQIWWRQNGEIFVLAVPSGPGSSADPVLYGMSAGSGGGAGFIDTGSTGILRFAPSPDRTSMALVREREITIVDSSTLDTLDSISVQGVSDIFWLDNSHLLMVGSRKLEIRNLETGGERLLLLASADDAGFDSDGRILADCGGDFYQYAEEESRWKPLSGGSGAMLPPRTESTAHRVYTEVSDSLYSNLIKVRTIDGFGNRNLFEAPVTMPVSLDGPTDGLQSLTDGVFDHGSRTRGRQVALVFNAVDGDEGLDDVLALLDAYGIPSTFFVSGDFIRRHPDSARDIAESGHETGSLFYTHMDMTDYRYLIDRDFIIRGLGRNEDEYFRTTGRELTTLWHAPWYTVSPAILEASAAMNYLYVGRDVDPQDWVSLDGDAGQRVLYKRNPDMLERVLEETRPGSIIPIRVGRPGEREDYFYMKLDLLVNNLLKSGYEFVTVGRLREISR